MLHEKILAEQMFSELQKKLTEQFRSESDAKEAEIAALKAHISVLQTAVEEMRRDLDDSASAPAFSKTALSVPARSSVESPLQSEGTSCDRKSEDNSSASIEKDTVDQSHTTFSVSCTSNQHELQSVAPAVDHEASSSPDPAEIRDAERSADQLASVDKNVQRRPVFTTCHVILLVCVGLLMFKSLTRLFITEQPRQQARQPYTSCPRANLHAQDEEC